MDDCLGQAESFSRFFDLSQTLEFHRRTWHLPLEFTDLPQGFLKVVVFEVD